MENKTNIKPIIRTKLNRPSISGDHLHRSVILNQLAQQRHCPLILVSAPAGYGKTTLISCWLQACGIPSAWVSLEKDDISSFHYLFDPNVFRIFSTINIEMDGN